jgi:TonB family protein
MKTTTFLLAGVLALAPARALKALEEPAVIDEERQELEVVDHAEIDRAPVVVRQVRPDYPQAIRQRGIEGFVTVEMVIGPDGRVAEARVAQASHPSLARPALEAARQWEFEPAAARGERVAIRVQVPFHFVMPAVGALEEPWPFESDLATE